MAVFHVQPNTQADYGLMLITISCTTVFSVLNSVTKGEELEKNENKIKRSVRNAKSKQIYVVYT